MSGARAEDEWAPNYGREVVGGVKRWLAKTARGSKLDQLGALLGVTDAKISKKGTKIRSLRSHLIALNCT